MKWDGSDVDVDAFVHPQDRPTKFECPSCFPPLLPGQDTICRPSQPDPHCEVCRGEGLVTAEERANYLNAR